MVPPIFATHLGQRCAGDITSAGRLEHCTAGRISYVLVADVHDLITGRPHHTCHEASPGKWSCEPDQQEIERVTLPSRLLGSVTVARDRDLVDEQRVYSDNARLWIVVVLEVMQQFPGGTIVIADRRLLADEDRASLRDLLHLSDEVDLDDDVELACALASLPSLPAGQNGRATVADTPARGADRRRKGSSSTSCRRQARRARRAR